MVILELIHAIKHETLRTCAFIRLKPIDQFTGRLFYMNLDNFADRMAIVPTTYLSNVCPINY